ncbi:unnamed protein product [Protopolystoma xenopodis]|uniref:Uncharacterized protein n=1 Tax=Protopolystoma xenopodis TaxID=117903 RepID=A0A448XAT9_9PLAT|nr:unnamed protein product [Protopolystoma xenopodis]
MSNGAKGIYSLKNLDFVGLISDAGRDRLHLSLSTNCNIVLRLAGLTGNADYDAGVTSGNVPSPRFNSGDYHTYYVLRRSSSLSKERIFWPEFVCAPTTGHSLSSKDSISSPSQLNSVDPNWASEAASLPTCPTPEVNASQSTSQCDSFESTLIYLSPWRPSIIETGGSGAESGARAQLPLSYLGGWPLQQITCPSNSQAAQEGEVENLAYYFTVSMVRGLFLPSNSDSCQGPGFTGGTVSLNTVDLNVVPTIDLGCDQGTLIIRNSVSLHNQLPIPLGYKVPWCAPLSGIHENLSHSTLSFSPSSDLPWVLSHSLSCSVRSVYSLYGSHISLDPFHPISAARVVIRPPLRLGCHGTIDPGNLYALHTVAPSGTNINLSIPDGGTGLA